MNDIAIQVENLSKKYRIGLAQHDTLRDLLMDSLRSPFQKNGIGNHESIWALKDVSFEVKRGEVVGLIGRNGAGKSTLLKILSRITEPTSGRAIINGRVGSLLEVGTGFHPELTGRENIYLNGAILGMRRTEIENKFDEIVAFSEIERFLDTPVKRYSSGMYVRLAFSVAAHLEPEVLLVDEVLAVGDAAFQRKCLGKIKGVATEGRTVIFVSHNMLAISSLCSRALLIEEGNLIANGSSDNTISEYLRNFNSASAEWVSPKMVAAEPVSLCAVRIRDTDGFIRNEFNNQEVIIVEIDVYMKRWIQYLKIGFDLETEWGGKIFTSFHNDCGEKLTKENFREGNYKFFAKIPSHLLTSNAYYVTPCATIHRRQWLFKIDRAVRFNVQFKIENPNIDVKNRDGVIGPMLDWSVSPSSV